MRSTLVLLALSGALGCARSVPPAVPTEVSPPPSPTAGPPIAVPDTVPRVVRRILREERELVERSATMARTLPDPSGRARAEREADELAAELAAIEGPLGAADSPALDELVRRMLVLATRIDLFYDTMRMATDKHHALAAD